MVRGTAFERDDFVFCLLPELCDRVGINIYGFEVECFASEGGVNLACPWVDLYFTKQNSFFVNLKECLGHKCYAYPPQNDELIYEMFKEICKLVHQDKETVFIIVLPVWEGKSWYKKFIEGNRVAQTLCLYPAGSLLFRHG